MCIENEDFTKPFDFYGTSRFFVAESRVPIQRLLCSKNLEFLVFNSLEKIRFLYPQNTCKVKLDSITLLVLLFKWLPNQTGLVSDYRPIKETASLLNI
jgi:hypothetical protein